MSARNPLTEISKANALRFIAHGRVYVFAEEGQHGVDERGPDAPGAPRLRAPAGPQQTQTHVQQEAEEAGRGE